ncbi:MAG: NAD(P)/FAD-dependent oxidoreductase [Acidimicrobiia bacterium]|nr:NAD(P)/FAD-dependent oxidoreductase [Acidimicrobiia bacterium]
MTRIDAVVIGAGPNGLTAAITLARAGRSVVVLEGADAVGGACRSAETTLPGFRHDLGAAVMPLGFASPAWGELPLADHGLDWIAPRAEFGQPLDGGRAAVAYRDIERTARGLGPDAERYRRLAGGLTSDWERLRPALLRPLLRVPPHPLTLARFGLRGIQPATRFVSRAAGDAFPALFGGCAAHAVLPLERPLTASFGLLFLALAHTTGWQYPRGGAGVLSGALASYLESLGGEIRLSRPIDNWSDLPAHRVAIFTTGPPALARIAGDRLPGRLRRRFLAWPYGPGAFKVDYALDGPIPWAAGALSEAGTVHVGGTIDEVAAAERLVAAGAHPERPFVLLAQPSVADPTRAPAGKHVAWAYCHVPNGSDLDMTERIESQIERFAPGFRDRILARNVTPPRRLQAMNPNLVGGDVGGGSHAGTRLLFRPTMSPHPYRVTENVFLGSASTPPGGGVHGMAGYGAARAALAGPLQ